MSCVRQLHNEIRNFVEVSNVDTIPYAFLVEREYCNNAHFRLHCWIDRCVSDCFLWWILCEFRYTIRNNTRDFLYLFYGFIMHSSKWFVWLRLSVDSIAWKFCEIWSTRYEALWIYFIDSPTSCSSQWMDMPLTTERILQWTSNFFECFAACELLNDVPHCYEMPCLLDVHHNLYGKRVALIQEFAIDNAVAVSIVFVDKSYWEFVVEECKWDETRAQALNYCFCAGSWYVCCTSRERWWVPCLDALACSEDQSASWQLWTAL